jgi:5-methylcytosine-specific restriction protein A
MIDFLYSFFHPRTFGAVRSSKWPAVMKAYRAEHPTCAVCGKGASLINPQNIHHVKPFHLHPELELDPTNLITLCRVDHLIFGHLKNFKSFNITVREDSALWYNKITTRPS